MTNSTALAPAAESVLPAGCNEIAASVETAVGALTAAGAGAGELLGFGDDELCSLVAMVEKGARLLSALQVSLAAEVADRSRFELGSEGLAWRHGHRKAVHLLEDLTRASEADVLGRMRLGSAFRTGTTIAGEPLPARYPAIAGAVGSGTVGADAASRIVRCLDQARQNNPNLDGVDYESLAVAEVALVEVAAVQSVDMVAVHSRVWREALDPDGTRPREENIHLRRGLTIGRERNGLTPFSGLAAPLLAAQLRAAVQEATKPGVVPRFISAEDEAAGTRETTTPDGEVIAVFVDPRSRQQRNHDMLEGLLTAGSRAAETGSGGMRSTSTVMAIINAEDLHPEDYGHDPVSGGGDPSPGIGWLEGSDEPVSATTVQLLACDAGFRTLVLGSHGEVLHEGRLQRYFTSAQRRALAVRDGGCVATGCSAPPNWCHAHHVDEWKQHNGKTDINNGVLLCPAHHYWLHHSSHRIRMINGRPHQLAPPELDPSQTWRPLGKSRALVTRALQLRREGWGQPR